MGIAKLFDFALQFHNTSLGFLKPRMIKGHHTNEEISHRWCHFPINFGWNFGEWIFGLRHDTHVANFPKCAKINLRFRAVNGYVR